MDNSARLQLDKMITENNVEDCTQDIRDKKHSGKIRDDVTKMLDLKKKYERLSKSNPTQFDAMLVSQCSFLFNNYTDIYNKIKKEEISLKILWEFLKVLERIEDGELDQHSGAYEVGTLLKKLYIDSALRREEKVNAKTGKKGVKKPKAAKKMSWKEYKASQEKL